MIVIAVVALLAAIIVPLIAKPIEEAKIAKAQAECRVIAAAINKFYSDVGVWPARSNGADHQLTRLSSAKVFPITTPYGYTSSNNDDWIDDEGNLVLIFNYLFLQLTENPGYPTAGESRWKGPYLPMEQVFGGNPGILDPWDHLYVCNIDAAYGGTGAANNAS